MSIGEISTGSSAATDDDTKNMSRIQLRERGLLAKWWKLAEIIRRCAPNKYLRATRASSYIFYAYNIRDDIAGCIAVQK